MQWLEKESLFTSDVFLFFLSIPVFREREEPSFLSLKESLKEKQYILVCLHSVLRFTEDDHDEQDADDDHHEKGSIKKASLGRSDVLPHSRD